MNIADRNLIACSCERHSGRAIFIPAVLAVVLLAAWSATPIAYAKEGAAPIVFTPCPTPTDGSPNVPQLCGTVSVPLDYNNPSGQQISIAVSKIPAANPAQRHGVLLVNPGGPGGTGVDIPRVLTVLFPPSILDTYDLIGFDPRGVGQSATLTCGLTAQQADRAFPTLTQSNSFAATVAFAQSVADACAREAGGVLPFLTTANTARDMDMIRQALGETTISYFAYSYGTYLGAVYATLFPNQTDRFVLDSNVDPQAVWRTTFRLWGPGGASRFPAFASFAAANNATYNLGSTAQQVNNLFFQTVAQLNETPVPLPAVFPDGSLVDGEFFRETVFGELDADQDFPILAEVWDLIIQAQSGSPGAAATVVAASADATRPVDNQVVSGLAVVCDDAAWSRSVPQYQAELTADTAAFPMFAPLGSNIEPCAFWPNQPLQPPVTISAKGPSNILMLQNLIDPATPYPGALQLHADLGQRSRLVSVDEGGHGIFGFSTNPCLNNAVIAYLVDGMFPSQDILCAAQTGSSAVEQPDAVRDGARQSLHNTMRLTRGAILTPDRRTTPTH